MANRSAIIMASSGTQHIRSVINKIRRKRPVPLRNIVGQFLAEGREEKWIRAGLLQKAVCPQKQGEPIQPEKRPWVLQTEYSLTWKHRNMFLYSLMLRQTDRQTDRDRDRDRQTDRQTDRQREEEEKKEKEMGTEGSKGTISRTTDGI